MLTFLLNFVFVIFLKYGPKISIISGPTKPGSSSVYGVDDMWNTGAMIITGQSGVLGEKN
jgi:hypothetical protein